MFSDSMMLGGGRKAAFSIAHSVRLDGVADYFTRTPSVAGNQKTWTFSCWVKRSRLSDGGVIFSSAISGTDAHWLYYRATDNVLYWQDYTGSNRLELLTENVFRDVSAWMHVLIALDTTQPSAPDRARIYVNGSRIVNFSTQTYPGHNVELLVNTPGRVMDVGACHYNGGTISNFFSGYVTQPIFIDGAALDPSHFGETDPITGSWRPKRPGALAANLPVYTMISRTAGTAIGNMTSGAGLAGLFDGNLSELNPSQPHYAEDLGWGGKAWGVGNERTVAYAIAYGSSNYGFYNSGYSVTLSLQGSDDGGSSWTTLGTTTFIDDGTSKPCRVDATMLAPYGRHRILIDAYSGATKASEFQFYEQTGLTAYGTNGFHLDFADATKLGHDISRGKLVAVTAPIGNMTANGGLAAAFDGVTDHAAPACATFAPGSGSTSPGWIGAHVGAGADITAVRVHASSNDGFVALVAGRVAVLELWGNNTDDTGTASKIADLGSVLDAVGLVVTKNGLSVDRDVYPYLWVKIYTSDTTMASKYAAEVQFVTGGDAPNTFNAVSLGATDVVSDTPTNNYATINTIGTAYSSNVFSNGNRTVSSNGYGVYPTIPVDETVVVYAEYTAGTMSGGVQVGVDKVSAAPVTGQYPGGTSTSYGYKQDGQKQTNAALSAYGSSWTSGDVISVLWDGPAGTLTYWKNGVSQGAAFSSIPAGAYWISVGTSAGSTYGGTWNFGQTAFVHTPPTGFKALCTANLPKPVIQAPAKHMDVVTYSGNADSSGGIWSPIVTDVTSAPGPISYIVGQNGDYLYVYQANNAYGTQAAFTVWKKNVDGTFTQTSSLSMPTGFSRGCVVLNTTQTGGSGFYGYISNGDAIGRVVTFTFSHTGGGSIVASDNIGYGTYPDGLLKLSNNLIAMNTGYSGGLHICFAIDANLAITKTNSVTGTLGINNGWASEMHKLSATSYLVAYKSSSTTNVGVVSCSGNTLTVTSIAQVFNYLTVDTKIIKLDDGRFWIHDSTNDYSAVINVVENTVNVVVSQFQQNVFGGLSFGMSWAYCDYNAWKKIGPDHWLIPVCHDSSGPNAQTMAILDLQINSATGTATALWQSPLTAPVSSRGTFWGAVYGDDVVASFSNDLYYYENAFSVGEWGPDSRTQVVSGLDFQPDLVWIKSRNGAADHAVYDSLRGARNRLETNNSDGEAGNDTGLTAFTGNGFSLGDLAQVNASGTDYVAWCWKAGGAPVANTVGSIPSTVSANPTAGFSIVTISGTGVNGTVGHGLGAAPKLIIGKRTNLSSSSWSVYHNVLGATKPLVLEKGAGETAYPNEQYWNNTEPTSSVFSIGSNIDANTSGGAYVFYCWAEIEGFSKFGGYTGNGSTDGPYLNLGFRARWVMFKRTDAANHWIVYDTARDTYNPASTVFEVNNNQAEAVGSQFIDVDAAGIKLRSAPQTTNASGGTYIFAAFAEYPFGGAKTTPAKAR